MKEVPYFLPLEEAIQLSLQHTLSYAVEDVALDEAHQRILAKGLHSKVNDPPFDNSAMDGFAVRFQDTQEAPSTLDIIATSQAAAGDEQLTVSTGQAVRIMTGAPVPDGADAIIPIEACTIDGNSVTLNQRSKPHFIRKRGENIAEGQVGLEKGCYLTPQSISMCATMGYSSVPVIQKLKIGIISTGDELKPPGEHLSYGEIYESNSFGLSGLVKMLGHIPIRYPAVHDSMDALRAQFDVAAQECDLFLTSGGVSMGEWDFVRKLMETEGDLTFWRVKIRPGSPPLFGHWKGTPMFGLPGNPVSSHVVFRMLVVPYLRGSLNTAFPHDRIVHARLITNVRPTKDCLTLRRVTLQSTEDGFLADQPKHQGSGNIDSLSSADGLTLLQPGQSGEAGELIQVLLL
ncbi:MAG: gephyrin-like molybdotransferase Glp [Candidatus Thermoplasmatota archaeon]|nr:gephyrin-like molybdotransferase Glp [Candidatus Thermoplasmatota archaeon]